MSGAGTVAYNTIVGAGVQRSIECNSGAYPLRVYNNTLVAGAYGAEGLGVEADAADLVLKNNIVTGFSGTGIYTNLTVTEDYNISYGNRDIS